MRGFAQGFMDQFRATSGTVFAGDPNADSSDVSRGIIKTSAIAALGFGAAGAAGAGASGGAVSSGTAGSGSGAGFFGGGSSAGGLTGTAGIAPGAAGTGTAASTIPFSTAGISGSSVAAGTAGGGAGFFGNTGGLTGQAGIAPQTTQEPSFLQRLNQQRSNINRGRRAADQLNQNNRERRFNDERNRFLTEQEQRQQQAALTGNPAAISATGITTQGQLFNRSLQAAMGAEDPREFRARMVQEATLEASQFEPGTPEFTRAATQAYASRGLVAEANQAQQQGLQAELRSAQIANQMNRARLVDAQTRKLIQESNQASLGVIGLTREEITKDSDGRKAWDAASREAIRRNLQRRARGDKVTTGAELLQEVRELASYALQNPGESSTVSRGDSGTTVTRNVPRRVDFSRFDDFGSVGRDRRGIGSPSNEPEPLVNPRQLQQAREARLDRPGPQLGVDVPVQRSGPPVGAESPTRLEPANPTANFSRRAPGKAVFKPTERFPSGGGQREERRRFGGAQKVTADINKILVPLNRLADFIDKEGLVPDGRVLGRDVATPLARAFGGERTGQLIAKRDRLEQFHNALVTVAKGEALDNLGALAGADLDLILKSIPSPTSRGVHSVSRDPIAVEQNYRKTLAFLYERLAEAARSGANLYGKPISLTKPSRGMQAAIRDYLAE